jgi:glycosyltransferase involved in cell wall biosynthesis
VDVLGYVSESEKRRLMAGARAFLMPAVNEDFGMTPIEAMASGTPVIAADEGYSQYQIRDGKNGYTFELTADGLASVVDRFRRDGVAWGAAQLRAFTRRYDSDQFEAGVHEAVQKAEAVTEITVDRSPDRDDPANDLPTVHDLAADGSGDGGN